MLTQGVFQRKKLLRPRQRTKKNSQQKISLKDLYLASVDRNLSPRFSGCWQGKNINSQRNSLGREKSKNAHRNLNIERKTSSKPNLHKYTKSTGYLSANNSAFMTCLATPKNTQLSPRNLNSIEIANVNPREGYKFIYQIGFGGFGKVWKVEQRKKPNKEYAMKQISKRKVIAKKSVDSVINERKILSSLDHPFLINMSKSFQDRENLYLTMDYLRGADLRYHICYKINFTENQARFIIACIVTGLEYVHSRNIIHRDIKPENIVFEENGYVRITDFGIANVKVHNKHGNTNETSGTPGYMAPEILAKEEHSYSSDFFALGVIAYQLMLNRRPYEGQNRKEIKDAIHKFQAEVHTSEIPKYWSVEAADFINRLLQRNPRHRMGRDGVEELKSHKWMQPIKWSKLEKKRIQPPFIPNVVCETREYLEEILLYNELNEENNENDSPITEEDADKFISYNYQKCSKGSKIETLNPHKSKKVTLFKKTRRCSQERVLF